MVFTTFTFIQTLTIILFTTISQISKADPIDCSLATSSSGCEQMTGCSWSNNECTGTYTPPCNPPTCHYIYPIGQTSSNPTGKHDDPFQNLNQAANKISTTDTTVYVAGDPNSPPIDVQIPVRTIVKSDMTIKPLLKTNFTLNFTGAFKQAEDKDVSDEVTSGQQCGLRTSSTGTIRIFNAYMEGETFNKRLFMVCNHQRTDLELDSVYLFDQLQFHDNQALLASKQYNNLYIRNSVFRNTSLGILLRSWSSGYFHNNIFEENYINRWHISSGSFKDFHFVNNTLNNIKPMGPLNEFIKLSQNPAVYREVLFENNKFSNVFSNAIRVDNIQNITFKGNSYKNIHHISPDQKPLIVIRGESSIDLIMNMHNEVFDNITVRGTVLYAENIALNAINTKWSSISKDYEPEHLVQYEALDYLINREVTGSCILMTTYGKLKVHNAEFTDINANCLATVQSALDVKKVSFNNTNLINKNSQFWDSYDAGVAWISFFEANPSAATCSIADVDFLHGGGIAEYGSGINIRSVYPLDITISSSNFTSLSAKEGGALYSKVSVGSISILNCIFATNNATQNGGAIYIQGESNSTSSFFRNSFVSVTVFENAAGSNGGGILLHTTNLQMRNVNIIKNKAFNGGGIYFNQPITISNHPLLRREQFKDIQLIINTAKGLGPAIKISDNDTELFTTSIGYLNLVDSNEIVPEEQNEPITRKWGLEQISYHKPSFFRVRLYEILIVEETTSTTNFAELINNQNHTSMVRQFFSNGVPTDLEIEVKSGHKFPMLIEITVLDQNKDTMVTINDEFVEFQLELADSSDTYTKAISFSDSFQKGIIYIKDQIEFIGKNGTQATLQIKSSTEEISPLLRDLGAELDLPIKIKFKPCEMGDIYNPNTLQCITCAPGTYSFLDPYDSQASCMECVENADCLRGSMISPKPGYYRYDTTTINFRKCEVEDSCLGGIVDSLYHPQGKCQEPYYGNLCSQCDLQSAKFGGVGQCQSCVNDWTYYLKFFLLFAASIITILATIWLNLRRAVLMKVALDNNDEAKKEIVKHSAFNAVVLKIAINFTLTKEVISDYGFKWPTFVNSIMSSLMNLFPTAEEGFSIDCFIVLISDDYDNVFYIKLISTILKPLFLLLLFLSCYFLFRKCFYRKQKLSSNEIKDRVILIIMAISYMSQTEIITSCLQLFKCSNFASEDSPQYFLDANPQIQCFTQAHLRWGLGFGISFFILWGIVFPALLYRKIKQVANDPYKRLRYSFIFAGMKQEHYYWEFIILLRKEIMVLILVFLRAFQIGGQIFLSLIVLGYFTYLQLSRKPFNDKKLNDLEFYSLISCIIMLIVGYFFYIQDSKGVSITSYVLSLIAVLSNLIFYALLAYNIIQSIRRNMKRVANAVKNKVLSHYNLVSQNSQVAQKGVDSPKNISDKKMFDQLPDGQSPMCKKNDQSHDFLLPDISKDGSIQDNSTCNLDDSLQSQKLSQKEVNSMSFTTKKKSLFGRALELENQKSTTLDDLNNYESCIDFDQASQKGTQKEESQESDMKKNNSEEEHILQEKYKIGIDEKKDFQPSNFKAISAQRSFTAEHESNQNTMKMKNGSFSNRDQVCEDIERDFEYFSSLKKQIVLGNDELMNKKIKKRAIDGSDESFNSDDRNETEGDTKVSDEKASEDITVEDTTQDFELKTITAVDSSLQENSFCFFKRENIEEKDFSLHEKNDDDERPL